MPSHTRPVQAYLIIESRNGEISGTHAETLICLPRIGSSGVPISDKSVIDA